MSDAELRKLFAQKLNYYLNANGYNQADLPHFRFHDLRHYSASIQHALGVPDAYIMERGGWKNDGVLKQVYRHTLEEKTAEMNRKVNGYFENLHHEMQHE